MDRELARRLPAQVIRRTGLPRHEIIVRRTRREVLAEVARLARRREVGSTYDLRPIPNGWALKVVRIKEPSRWRIGWRWPVLAGALALALWLALLLVQALLALAPFLLAGLGLLAVVAALASGPAISVVQSVVIKR
jgi:hypothetical protein